MKYSVLVLCVVFVAVGSLAGCKSMALKDLDADMPKVLVERYDDAETAYADEGCRWLPLLHASSGHVSTTREGFHAKRFQATGPLMLLAASNSSADFDDHGRLVRHSTINATLWGLLFVEDTSEDLLKEKSSYRFRILWGLLGYRETSADEKTVYVLYLPISI